MIHGYLIGASDNQDALVQLKAAGCDKIHRETRDTGAASRTRRERLLEQLGEGDVLVVARLSQAADSTIDLVRIMTVVTQKKATLRSVAEPWADTNARGVRFVAVLEGIAAFEREIRASRTETGQARALARGVRLGRRPKLTPKQEQEARRRRARGETLAQIAEAFNVSHSTISRLVA